VVQIVHCADLHLGKHFNISRYAHALKRKKDLERNFSAIADYALKDKPDLFLVSGDIYDRILPANFERIFLIRKIRELRDAGIQVFMVGGNHDVPKTARQSNLAIDSLESAGLATVFSSFDSIQHKIINVAGKKVCISGKSYNPYKESQSPLRSERISLNGQYNILILHAAFHGLNVNSSVPYFANQNPIRTEDVKRGINYLALGHYHNPFIREHEGCKICNPGSIEKMTWAEEHDEKGFIWAELNRDETQAELIPLETRPMESRELLLSKNTGNIGKFITEFLEKCADPNALFRLYLKGKVSQEQYRRFKMNELYRFSQQQFFHFDLIREDLEVEGYGKIFMGRIDTPIEAFTKRLDLLIENASNGEREFLKLVKEVGVKYLEGNT
jgi:DNA repair exonuclease SbcCD nuclease subunit